MSFQNAKIVGKSVSPTAYHKQDAQRGKPGFVMSSGALREFAVCPDRWVRGYQGPDSTAQEWGSLLDCLLTSPDRFDDIYAIQPATYTNEKKEVKPWNNNATVCREWQQEQKDFGKEVADSKLVTKCKEAIARLRRDELIESWLDSCECQVWVASEWHDKPTGIVLPCKALLDFVPRVDSLFGKCLGDFKTTKSAAIMPWQRWCFQAGYHTQAAFYSDQFIAATGEDRNTWCFIVQENYEPYQPGKRMLSQDFLTLGRATYAQMLANYCQCLKSGRWPSYDDTDEAIQGWSLVAPEPFMAERAAFAPRYEFDDDPTCPSETMLNAMAEQAARGPGRDDILH